MQKLQDNKKIQTKVNNDLKKHSYKCTAKSVFKSNDHLKK